MENWYAVAPFTGAWIEIALRGKYAKSSIVAPFTGAWIEMYCRYGFPARFRRRTLHGCVD